ncbi:unnamed protein product [Orchesella dallaii]|uniref:Uncharacterized protein n=1 Tax=Orchesella dallaii TaxID=48710 RepID=A0ABP1PTM4_9HEXA
MEVPFNFPVNFIAIILNTVLFTHIKFEVRDLRGSKSNYDGPAMTLEEPLVPKRRDSDPIANYVDYNSPITTEGYVESSPKNPVSKQNCPDLYDSEYPIYVDRYGRKETAV